jgi:hypothetical protein
LIAAYRIVALSGAGGGRQIVKIAGVLAMIEDDLLV